MQPEKPIEPLDPMLIKYVVETALREDLGQIGDVTSHALIPANQRGKAMIVARQAGSISGLDCAQSAFITLDPEGTFKRLAKDGDKVVVGTKLASIECHGRALLSAERTALNFMGRLSGIATLTRKYADAIAHTKAKIVDTRKTTPGLRAFEKYAVRCGGGHNHRFGLYDAILIKDNHVALAGGVANALQKAGAAAGDLSIEIEVDTLAQLEEALKSGATRVLLDNMNTDELREAVALNAGRAVLEASGGVSLATVAAIAETGVDIISSGALTHSAPNFDVALDIEI